MHVLRQTAFNNAMNQITKLRCQFLEPHLERVPFIGKEKPYLNKLHNLCLLIKEQYEQALKTLQEEITDIPVTDGICQRCKGTGESVLGVYGRGCAACCGTGSGKVQEHLDKFRATCG